MNEIGWTDQKTNPGNVDSEIPTSPLHSTSLCFPYIRHPYGMGRKIIVEVCLDSLASALQYVAGTLLGADDVESPT